MIGRVTGNISHPLHDIRTEVGDGLGVVDPDRNATVMFDQFVKRSPGMGAGGREITKGMQAIDMPATDEGAKLFAIGIGRIPIGKLARRHVEVEGISDFQADAWSHAGFLGGVEESHELEVSRRIGRFVKIAADGESGRQERREDGLRLS